MLYIDCSVAKDMTEKLSNYTSQEGTLYTQMGCGTQRGPAKSPEQPLSIGCLAPSPCSLSFTLIRSFVPFTCILEMPATSV